jgi:hypothetical protein
MRDLPMAHPTLLESTIGFVLLIAGIVSTARASFPNRAQSAAPKRADKACFGSWLRQSIQ